MLVQNRSRKPEKGPNAVLEHAKAVFNDFSNDSHEMFSREDSESKQIVEWDDLKAHDENSFHQI